MDDKQKLRLTIIILINIYIYFLVTNKRIIVNHANEILSSLVIVLKLWFSFTVKYLCRMFCTRVLHIGCSHCPSQTNTLSVLFFKKNNDVLNQFYNAYGELVRHTIVRWSYDSVSTCNWKKQTSMIWTNLNQIVWHECIRSTVVLLSLLREIFLSHHCLEETLSVILTHRNNVPKELLFWFTFTNIFTCSIYIQFI